MNKEITKRFMKFSFEYIFCPIVYPILKNGISIYLYVNEYLFSKTFPSINFNKSVYGLLEYDIQNKNTKTNIYLLEPYDNKTHDDLLERSISIKNKINHVCLIRLCELCQSCENCKQIDSEFCEFCHDCESDFILLDDITHEIKKYVYYIDINERKIQLNDTILEHLVKNLKNFTCKELNFDSSSILFYINDDTSCELISYKLRMRDTVS